MIQFNSSLLFNANTLYCIILISNIIIYISREWKYLIPYVLLTFIIMASFNRYSLAHGQSDKKHIEAYPTVISY